jgi:RsiW-degrading membrane proteinase PrsW (M82 family)
LWWFDRYEKEPLPLLFAAFLWGAVPAIIFSLVAQVILDIPISYFVSPTAADLVGAAVIAPVTEEIFKGVAVLLLLLLFRREIDSPLDGIIYGGLVGFGFAAVENIFYFANELMGSGLGGVIALVVLRSFVFGLNHALFTGLTGLGLALARTAPTWPVRVGAPVAGLLAGMVAHGVHNAGVSGADLCWPCLLAFLSDWGGVLILFVVILWAIVREQRWITTYLANEVQLGTLSQDDYRIVCSSAKRFSVRLHALAGGDFERWWDLGTYYRLATELAFNKRRLVHFPEEADTQAHVERLRKQVAALGDRL